MTVFDNITDIVIVDAFLIYAMPLLGGYLADTHWGRYKTITLAIFMYLLGNAILIVASSPPLLAMPKGALALLITAIVVQAMGTGSIKACTGYVFRVTDHSYSAADIVL